MAGYVYLLHFDRPISERHTAQHYIGYAHYMPSRMQDHMRDRGVRFTQVAHERGIGFTIAAVWPGDRRYERQLKRKKHAARFCPICRCAYDPRQLTLDLSGADLL